MTARASPSRRWSATRHATTPRPFARHRRSAGEHARRQSRSDERCSGRRRLRRRGPAVGRGATPGRVAGLRGARPHLAVSVALQGDPRLPRLLHRLQRRPRPRRRDTHPARRSRLFPDDGLDDDDHDDDQDGKGLGGSEWRRPAARLGAGVPGPATARRPPARGARRAQEPAPGGNGGGVRGAEASRHALARRTPHRGARQGGGGAGARAHGQVPRPRRLLGRRARHARKGPRRSPAPSRGSTIQRHRPRPRPPRRRPAPRVHPRPGRSRPAPPPARRHARSPQARDA
mmetsp:Transcript_19721/g.61021  ORF Transcript_19721/g.61021 Transcript_19721/m.61021 type:complete len:288 (+) Transcript_19721:843-1706(+)